MTKSIRRADYFTRRQWRRAVLATRRQRHRQTKKCSKQFAPADRCHSCLSVALFKFPPLALVIPDERLVIEPIDLDRHRLDILRKPKHRRECLVLEQTQPAR